MWLKTKNVSVLFYKNRKSSFSTLLSHLTFRFLYILGCSGPWCAAAASRRRFLFCQNLGAIHPALCHLRPCNIQHDDAWRKNFRFLRMIKYIQQESVVLNPNNYILRQKCNFHNHQVENNRAFFPNILDVFPAMDLVISSVVLAKFSFSKVLFFSDFQYPFWLFENPSWNIYCFTWSKGPFHYIANKILIFGEVGWQWPDYSCQLFW